MNVVTGFLARKIPVAAVMSLLAAVLIMTPSARAESGAVPANGDYMCSTGLPAGYNEFPAYRITDGAVWGGSNCIGAVVIPAGVTTIREDCFADAWDMTSIALPASVTSIGDLAFGYTAIVSIKLPAGMTRIGAGTFRGARALTSITIPAGVTSIGDLAFWQATKLKSVTLPAGVTSIGRLAFADMSALTSITIPAGVTSIGENAFAGSTKLKSVTLPAGVTSIGRLAFDLNTSITFTANNQNSKFIDGVLFSKDATRLIQYPAGKNATSYSVPAGVKSIGYRAFSGVTKLTSITIPASVTSIGSAAFAGATALTSIKVASGNQSYRDIDRVLFNKKVSELIQFPVGNSATSYSIPVGLGSIGEYAFYSATALSSITIPASLASFGEDAFYKVSSLKDIYIPGDNPTLDNEDADSWSFTGHARGAEVHVRDRAGFPRFGSRWRGLLVVEGAATPKALKASYVSGAIVTGSPKANKSITVLPGKWNGEATIAHTYQWYSCSVASKKVLTTGQASPKCSLIKGATDPAFKVSKKVKGSFLGVLITGTNRIGKSTIFTTTVGKVS